MSKTLKVRRLLEIDNASEPLHHLIKTLNLANTPTIYECSDKIYIHAKEILSLLNVSESWFKNNAGVPDHYISIKNEIYVNKYGFTKILSQSREKIAVRIQDYIYEIIYKLESSGTVGIEDVESRKALIEETDFYRVCHMHNKEIADVLHDELKTLQMDYRVLNQENDQLNNKLNELSNDNIELTKLVKKIINQIKTVCYDNSIKKQLFIKPSMEKVIRQFSDINDMFEDDYIDNKKYVNKIKETNEEKTKQDLYILQHINDQYHPNRYWLATRKIEDYINITVKEYIEYSNNYHMPDDEKTVLQKKYIKDIQYTYWSTLNISDQKANFLEELLDHLNCTETQLKKLIDMFIRI